MPVCTYCHLTQVLETKAKSYGRTVRILTTDPSFQTPTLDGSFFFSVCQMNMCLNLLCRPAWPRTSTGISSNIPLCLTLSILKMIILLKWTPKSNKISIKIPAAIISENRSANPKIRTGIKMSQNNQNNPKKGQWWTSYTSQFQSWLQDSYHQHCYWQENRQISQGNRAESSQEQTWFE